MRQELLSLSCFVVVCLTFTGCSQGNESATSSVDEARPVNKSAAAIVPVQSGDMAHSGGSPTVRKAFRRSFDDPSTTNDESNDQPVGHFGTVTLTVHNVSSGNTYSLDADVNGTEVERIYFPKGGWVDLVDGEIDSTGNGSGTDEKGNQWEFEGFDSGSMPTAIAEADAESEDEDE